MTTSTLDGKPYAGNPHVRFDEGEVASEKPRRGSLLYKELMVMAVTASVMMLAFGAEKESFFTKAFAGDAMSEWSFGGERLPSSYVGKPQVVMKSCEVYPVLPTNVPMSVTSTRFKFGRKGGFTATYVVLAENLVDIDLDSLVIESICDAAGKDRSKRKDGDPAWEVDEFRKSVSRDAGFGVFTLHCGGKTWGASLPTIKGRVKAVVADKMVTKEIEGKVSSGKIGDGDLAYKVKIARGFMSEEKNLEVKAVGKRTDCEIEVWCAGKKLNKVGSMMNNGVASYLFSRPADDTIIIKVTYAGESREIELSF